ncbi:DUF3658 domain-containing protein [Gynuella sunshinyii]|uniref:DUF3658 domain-containing protein n=1 Tax=Gynuella sunshinyii YC6258 TaxID=1445510 RepID=A0A0C5VXB7_9GAMM|nr:DUF3658 domain-containing protein [Gynuella sunshinyii]AJQ95079.1 hypothetical Protein YC6258_03041 [Gynuella sunshinyii YC6258]
MSSIESLNQLLSQAVENLELALEETMELKRNEKNSSIQIGKLGRSIGLIREFQSLIFKQHPELAPKSVVPDEEIPELNQEQKQAIASLTPEDIKRIDEELMSFATNRFQKVANIVGLFMLQSERHEPSIPDVFYGERIKILANAGLLESQGNLKFMRYSEVRIAKT